MRVVVLDDWVRFFNGKSDFHDQYFRFALLEETRKEFWNNLDIFLGFLKDKNVKSLIHSRLSFIEYIQPIKENDLNIILNKVIESNIELAKYLEDDELISLFDKDRKVILVNNKNEFNKINKDLHYNKIDELLSFIDDFDLPYNKVFDAFKGAIYEYVNDYFVYAHILQPLSDSNLDLSVYAEFWKTNASYTITSNEIYLLPYYA